MMINPGSAGISPKGTRAADFFGVRQLAAAFSREACFAYESASKLAHSKEICSPSSLHVGNAAGGLDAERAMHLLCRPFRARLWSPCSPRVLALRASTLGFILPRFQRWIQNTGARASLPFTFLLNKLRKCQTHPRT
jgi:hypothetical protein